MSAKRIFLILPQHLLPQGKDEYFVTKNRKIAKKNEGVSKPLVLLPKRKIFFCEVCFLTANIIFDKIKARREMHRHQTQIIF